MLCDAGLRKIEALFIVYKELHTRVPPSPNLLKMHINDMIVVAVEAAKQEVTGELTFADDFVGIAKTNRLPGTSVCY